MTEIKQNPIIQWAESRPEWEKYIWKKCLENGTLTELEIDEAYKIFSVENKIVIGTLSQKINLTGLLPTEEAALPKIWLKELKDCKNLNAIPDNQSIKFRNNLTLIYGSNGSGKSGFGRLISNACYSKGRGEKKILHNLKKGASTGIAKAKFILDNDKSLHYVNNGKPHGELKRFSVFDYNSVPIHLNGSNTVQFAPGQIQIFDLVNGYISEIEERFESEKQEKYKENPVENIFDDVESSVSKLLSNISAANTKEEIEAATKFTKSDETTLKELLKQKNEKIKLNVPEKKKQLHDEQKYLTQYKKLVEAYLINLSTQSVAEVNKLIKTVLAKQELVKKIGTQNFNTGILKTVGSEKWEALLFSAKELYDAEKKARKGVQIENCLLCQQKLGEKQLSLYEAYWRFLENTAEEELTEAKAELTEKLEDIQNLQITAPSFDSSQPAIKILQKSSAPFVKEVKDAVTLAKKTFKDWETKIKAKKEIAVDKIKILNYTILDSMVTNIKKESESLKDPSTEIQIIERKLTELQHRKKIKNLKSKLLLYLNYKKWISKAGRIQFPKSVYTKQRKTIFNQIVTEEYKITFNIESKNLDSEFGLVVESRGASGDTILEYKLDFASGYKPTDVLSEGEQKVAALADFLTEVQLNKNNCGIIFDDPVTSLDHDRKEKISERIVLESKKRQVIVFTHDLVFMSKLVRHASENDIEFDAHWIHRSHEGIPGFVEHNKNPKLSNLASLKKDAEESVKEYATLGEKEKEKAIGVALDYLRSACESMVGELLLAGAMHRYDDHIKMQNIEEMPFEKESSLELVSLHGKLSEFILAHNRSDEMREKLISIDDFKSVKKTFDELEKKLKDARKKAKDEREERKKKLKESTKGW